MLERRRRLICARAPLTIPHASPTSPDATIRVCRALARELRPRRPRTELAGQESELDWLSDCRLTVNRRTSWRGAAAEVFFGTRGPCAGLRAQIPVHARSLSAANAGRNVKWPRQGEIVSSASGAPAPQGLGPPAQASSDTSLAPSSFLYLRPLGKMCLQRISIAAVADSMPCPAPTYAHVQPLMCDAVPALLQCSDGQRCYSGLEALDGVLAPTG